MQEFHICKLYYGIFIHYIGKASKGLKDRLTRAKVFVVLWDGTIYR